LFGQCIKFLFCKEILVCELHRSSPLLSNAGS
jgi:hypothetical protein